METWIANRVAKVSTGTIKEANGGRRNITISVSFWQHESQYKKTIGHYINVQGSGLKS